MWAYDGSDGRGAPQWDSLEQGLWFVLDRLHSSQELFLRYKTRYQVIWWCGHFQSSFDGGPTLSSRLLERLAAFGVDLFIDNYFSAANAANQEE